MKTEHPHTIGGGRASRFGRVAAIAALPCLLLVAGCEQTGLAGLFAPQPPPTPVPTSTDLVDRAVQCGRSLGVAVRCNLVRDEANFAALRQLTLSGLRRQAGTADFSPVENALDVATLETMNTISACTTGPADLPILEREVETTLAMCAPAP